MGKSKAGSNMQSRACEREVDVAQRAQNGAARWGHGSWLPLWSISCKRLHPFPHTDGFWGQLFHPQGDCLPLSLSWVHPVTVDSPSACLHLGQVTLLLLLLSHFSCVRLCATPEMAAHQAPPVPGILQARTLEWVPQCVKVKSEVAQSCPTLSDRMDCSLPGYSIHGISQARVLEWVPLPSPPGDAIRC